MRPTSFAVGFLFILTGGIQLAFYLVWQSPNRRSDRLREPAKPNPAPVPDPPRLRNKN
jgi:hypothetical protein